MDEQSRPPEEPNLPKNHFHITLALAFVPCGAVIGGWTLAIMDVLKGYSNRAQLFWMRLLVALVVVDALALGSLLWFTSRLEEFQKKAEAARRPRPVIGLVFEDGGLRVKDVPDGLPGRRAGLHEGDVVVGVDDTPVETFDALSEALRGKNAGEPRTLTATRDGVAFQVPIVPEAPPAPGEKGLFQVEKGAPAPVADEAVVGMLPGLVLVVILALLSKWRSTQRIPVWGGFLLALFGATGGLLAFLAATHSLSGGLSLGHFLIGIMVQSLLMGALTFAAGKWLTREVPPIPATMPPARAGAQGCFYLITGMMRIGVLLLVAAYALFPDAPLGDPLAMQLSQARFGVFGGVLLFLGLAVLGPIAEEYLFRGYLLPRLVAQWGEWPGLIASSLLFAILHLRDGPFIPVIFFYGWIFGWARLRSGGLGAPIVLHMTVNAVAAAGILLNP